MIFLVLAVFSTVAAPGCATYRNSSHDPPLTQVPDNIKPDETTVVLENNALTSLGGRLDHLTNLKGLFLLDNKFATFPNLSMVGDTLQILAMGRNYIADISLESLIPLTKLAVLVLYNNKFTTFPDLSPLGNTILRLEMSFNALSEMSSKVLTSLIKLRDLSLYANHFAIFPDLSPVGNTLQKLNIGNNKMKLIPAGRLDSLVKLVELKLQGNHLTTLPDVSASSHTLVLYTLARNPIERVGPKEMRALNGISNVVLHNTKLISLPPVCYDKPTHLTLTDSTLDLCACNNVWLKKAEEGGNLTLMVTDVVCPDATKPWTQLTSDELTNVCQPAEESDCLKGEILHVKFCVHI